MRVCYNRVSPSIFNKDRNSDSTKVPACDRKVFTVTTTPAWRTTYRGSPGGRGSSPGARAAGSSAWRRWWGRRRRTAARRWSRWRGESAASWPRSGRPPSPYSCRPSPRSSSSSCTGRCSFTEVELNVATHFSNTQSLISEISVAFYPIIVE